MTTLETLHFYAGLILPAELTNEQKEKRIDSVLEALGLTAHKDSMVSCIDLCAIMGPLEKCFVLLIMLQIDHEIKDQQ